MRYAYLFQGLTLRRVFAVSAICVAFAAACVWFFLNTFWDLLVSALCVGYTSMVLFTIAGNLRALESHAPEALSAYVKTSSEELA